MATKIFKSGNYIIIDDGVNIKEIPAKDCSYDSTGSQYTIVDNIKGYETTAIAFADIRDESDVAYASEAIFVSFLRSNTGSDVSSETSATENQDPWIKHAKNIIFADDGVNVTLEAKNKDLLKFGRNKLVGVVKTTLMTLPTGTDNEVLPTTNAINSIISNNAGDTETVRVEGHTTADGGLTFVFVAQNAILTGQTVVALTTPLARVSRVVNVSATDLTGRVYVTETDTYTAGVPDTNSKVHLIVEAGLNNSEKAATTLSSSDYWVVTGFYGDCLEKSANFGILHLEIRESGKTFSNKIDISATTNSRGNHEFKPYLIVKPNSDIRLRVTSGTANKDFSGGIQGALLTTV